MKIVVALWRAELGAWEYEHGKKERSESLTSVRTEERNYEK